MHIESVRLENVKCFEDITLHFQTHRTGDPQSNWNVILGNNGDGKTSLLQAIAACLMDSTTAGRMLNLGTFIRKGHPKARLTTTIAPDENDDWDRNYPLNPIYSEYTAQYLIMGANQEMDGVFYSSDTILDPNLAPGFDPKNPEKMKLARTTNFLKRHAFTRREKKGWISCGYGAFRRISGFASHTVTITDPLQKRFLTLFEEGASLYDCEHWLKELTHSERYWITQIGRAHV